ncbi:AraC family transcriptional regulator [Neorhizobium alkalisoli]|uniref:AraC family transcriptional regulator n=1 Tax=Neorhizobium alkalisoli TaxID=528178 RepID=A0A561QPF1_9HYPH|nr:AraC family transcriptional regulator [Neorhizobium alkalisoli]TWF52275.1 AraC family transcriptional regulator [Neorhizobium alkalisoli]
MESICPEAGAVGRYFGTPQADCLTTIPVRSAPFSVTRITRDVVDGDVFRVELPAQPAYFLMLYVEDTVHSDTLADGTETPLRRYERGSVCLVDMQDGACITLYSSLKALGFVLPRQLLDEVADMSLLTRPNRLRCRRAWPDEVMGNLGMAMAPLFDAPSASPPSLLRHIALAVCAHLLHDYGDETMRNGVSDSALSIQQEKSAKEFMLANMAGDISVAEIAAAAGLSANHFSEQFKRATGLTPYQWLTRMRIDQAKDFLRSRRLALPLIADRCGFTDQSHFTKVFSRETGMTPAAWRAVHLQ